VGLWSVSKESPCIIIHVYYFYHQEKKRMHCGYLFQDIANNLIIISLHYLFCNSYNAKCIGTVLINNGKYVRHHSYSVQTALSSYWIYQEAILVIELTILTNIKIQNSLEATINCNFKYLFQMRQDLCLLDVQCFI
jgi:hypothetical protein